MQLVIKISDDTYNYWKEMKPTTSNIYMIDAIEGIINGTPLSKGHGRLIDIDAAYHTLRQYVSFDDLDEVMSNLNCVLEADKEGQDETDSD